MTEVEWRDCADPVPMLGLLRDRATDPRLRLFVCACCRRVWRSLPPGEQRLYEVMEAFADGRVPFAALAGAYDDAVRGASNIPNPLTTLNAAQVAVATARLSDDGPAEARAQADLVRCLFSCSFRPVAFPGAWRTDTVESIARRLDEAREFSAMPILADALQDAGCDNEAILSHCREAVVHVRGCFVVDLVLGRE